MFPLLVSIGPLRIYTISIFIILATWLGLFVIWKRAKELHYEERELFDMVLVVLGWMFVGARCGYALIHAADFAGDYLSILNIIKRPGWYFPTGLLAGGLATFFQTKRHRFDTYQVMDIFVTGLILAQTWLALGSWFAGTGYGISTDSFIGMTFSGLYDKRYPVQLFEFVGFGACFIYLWKVESVYRTFSWYRRNKSQAATGFLVGTYLLWWGIIELLVTLYRTPAMQWGGVRFDLAVPVFLGIFAGIWILGYRSGMSGEDILGYFGLYDKEKMREKRLKMIKESLEKQ